jgi:glycosyltransferase involved in cell wall biosynthesis
MKFSLIVANYNNNEYLPQLINSVFKQTFTNWELIIVDDFSDEDPINLITPFLAADNRILYIRHDTNKGVGAAFKTACDNSTGDIIGMLGADDAITEMALEAMVKAHELHTDASLINSECYWCDEELNIIEKYQYYKALEKGQSLIRNLSIGSFATFKRSAYFATEGFNPHFKRAVDHDIYLKLDEVGGLVFLYEPLYLYRRNIKGISQNVNGTKAAQYSIQAKYNAYKRRLGTGKDNLTSKEIKALRKIWYLRQIYNERICNNRKACNKLYLEMIKEQPFLIFNKAGVLNLIRNNFLQN